MLPSCHTAFTPAADAQHLPLDSRYYQTGHSCWVLLLLPLEMHLLLPLLLQHLAAAPAINQPAATAAIAAVAAIPAAVGDLPRTAVRVRLRGRALDLPLVGGGKMRLLATTTTSLPLNFFSSSRTRRCWILWKDFSRRKGTCQAKQPPRTKPLKECKQQAHRSSRARVCF